MNPKSTGEALAQIDEMIADLSAIRDPRRSGDAARHSAFLRQNRSAIMAAPSIDWAAIAARGKGSSWEKNMAPIRAFLADGSGIADPHLDMMSRLAALSRRYGKIGEEEEESGRYKEADAAAEIAATAEGFLAMLQTPQGPQHQEEMEALGRFLAAHK